MATVNFSGGQSFTDNQTYIWTPLTTTNVDGQPTGYTGAGDRTVQVTGTFGVGGTVVIQGSLDGTNWATLNGLDGATALSFTAAGLRGVLENAVYVRPLVTGGDGTTSITVRLCVRNSQ